MKQYIKNQKLKKMEGAGYRCEYIDEVGARCISKATETAHRIGQGKYARRAVYQKIKDWHNYELTEKEIDMIIWHEDNFVACCSNKAHNDSFNIHISQTEKFDKLLRKIWYKFIVARDKRILQEGIREALQDTEENKQAQLEEILQEILAKKHGCKPGEIKIVNLKNDVLDYNTEIPHVRIKQEIKIKK